MKDQLFKELELIVKRGINTERMKTVVQRRLAKEQTKHCFPTHPTGTGRSSIVE